jgi:hypothetical protein
LALRRVERKGARNGYWQKPRHRPCGRLPEIGCPRRSQTLRAEAIVDWWRARQSIAAGACLIAPAIHTRPAFADSAFAVALKTQRSHALTDRGEVVGGAGCVRRHLGAVNSSCSADKNVGSRFIDKVRYEIAGRARNGDARSWLLNRKTERVLARVTECWVRDGPRPVPALA